MTDIQKMYMHRAVMHRIEWCKQTIHDMRGFSPSGKPTGKFEPTGTPTEKAILDEIQGLEDAIFEITGAHSFGEFLELVNA